MSKNKIKKIGNITIINDKDVIKDEPDLTTLFNYLNSRDFHYFIPIKERDNERNIYDYEVDYSLNDNQKALDLATTIALLHNKTSFQKDVKIDTYNEIYDNTLGYINYVDDYYYKLLKKIEFVSFPSPSELIFLSNYSKIKEAIDFAKRELDNWRSMLGNNTKKRVCMDHGNPSIDHIIVNEKSKLISWKNHTIDSPILDLIKLYHNDWQRIDYSSFLEKYESICELKKEEKSLLFINISIPLIYKFSGDEMDNVRICDNIFNYIYKTEKLIMPYYTIENSE